MPLKKPLPVLEPHRLRRIPRSFAWIDHRLRSEGLLKKLWPEDIGLYLFLTLAADRNGLSCWRLDRIERDIPSFDRHALTHEVLARPSDIKSSSILARTSDRNRG